MEDFNTAVTATAIGAAAEPAKLTCQQQLDINSVDIGYATSFDNKMGRVYIIGGDACWEEIMDVVDTANRFVEDQLATLGENGVKVEDLGIPNYDSFKAIVNEVKNYTDGYLLVAGWSWRTDSVKPGDSVGVCFTQQGGPAEQAASCWAYTMRTDGEYKDDVESYLVMPSQITATTKLSDFTDKSNDMTPGLFGSWMCLPPITMLDITGTSCLRLMPSKESATTEDPRFEIGPVTVMTYETSRINNGNSTNFNNNESLQTEQSSFEFFQLILNGAKFGTQAAGLALAATAAILAF